MSAHPPGHSFTDYSDKETATTATYELPTFTMAGVRTAPGGMRGMTLQSPPGNGDNGAMENRVAKLEIAMDHVQHDISELKTDMKEVRRDITSIRTTDFRLLFGAIIAVALGLAWVMAKGFHWM